MKLESVIQRFYGRNTSLSVNRACKTMESFLQYKVDVLRKNGGRNFCRYLRNSIDILRNLNKEQVMPDSDMHNSFYDFFHGSLSKIYEYLSNNPEITRIESDLLDIETEELLKLKKNFEAVNLKLRNALNDLSETFDIQHVCIIHMKNNINRIKEIRKSKIKKKKK